MIRSSRWLSGALLSASLLVALAAGCATDELAGPEREAAASPAPDAAPGSAAPTVPLAGRTEPDLVQEMTLHRTMYARFLRALATFYSENGYEQKARWARAELEQFDRVRKFSYITDAEVSTSDVANGGGDLPKIQLAGRHEPDLVEDLVLHRGMYIRYLRALVSFYSENGFDKKANWSRTELKELQKVKQYTYIWDAELPLASLRPTESIADADKLYDEGQKLLNRGGHHVAIFFNRATMNLALAKFKEVISKYPTSDKIDDAAYYIGEIYKEYGEERDNELAIEWYKRATEWNPKLPHPAWSHAAHILDFRMHEREKALEWYYKVLENEKDKDKTDIRFLKNIDVANKRIAELTAEKTRHAPGEPTPTVQPAPVVAPADSGAQPK